MNNPYDYLGIGRNATEQQVMDAYRRIAGEIQSSDISDSEKTARMNELNNAYDTVVNEMRGTSAYQNTSNSQNNYYSDSQFSDVRQNINDGRIDEAETILNGIPTSMRTAEWHFLKGVIHQRRGWLNEAYRCYQTACSIDPSNAEYAAAFNAMNGNVGGGYKTTPNRDRMCDICTGLICADCCCECMGGDLIPCC
ncbi:MAG: tetratricopeptide repeat protein [Oscillospiraceae bacterium]|nr:tetratricopeptide repeat protein [Oscillospiraceae bacterium]